MSEVTWSQIPSSSPFCRPQSLPAWPELPLFSLPPRLDLGKLLFLGFSWDLPLEVTGSRLGKVWGWGPRGGIPGSHGWRSGTKLPAQSDS